METKRIMGGTAALKLLDQIFTMLSYISGESDAKNGTDLPVVVAIDTESSDKHFSELGFSTFDPTCLTQPKDDHPDSLHGHITTYCYAKGGSKNRIRYKPYRFGTSTKFQNTELQQLLRAHLEPRDTDGNLRKVILVGQNIITDLLVLENYSGLNLACIMNVQAILDTSNIGQSILNTTQPVGLRKLLRFFNLEYIGLHNAGHDSRYTLRVLLMLFLTFKQLDVTSMTERMASMIRSLEEIARFRKIQEGRKWCESKRVKMIGITNIVDQDVSEDEDGGCGMLALLTDDGE